MSEYCSNNRLFYGIENLLEIYNTVFLPPPEWLVEREDFILKLPSKPFLLTDSSPPPPRQNMSIAARGGPKKPHSRGPVCRNSDSGEISSKKELASTRTNNSETWKAREFWDPSPSDNYAYDGRKPIPKSNHEYYEPSNHTSEEAILSNASDSHTNPIPDIPSEKGSDHNILKELSDSISDKCSFHKNQHSNNHVSQNEKDAISTSAENGLNNRESSFSHSDDSKRSGGSSNNVKIINDYGQQKSSDNRGRAVTITVTDYQKKPSVLKTVTNHNSKAHDNPEVEAGASLPTSIPIRLPKISTAASTSTKKKKSRLSSPNSKKMANHEEPASDKWKHDDRNKYRPDVDLNHSSGVKVQMVAPQVSKPKESVQTWTETNTPTEKSDFNNILRSQEIEYNLLRQKEIQEAKKLPKTEPPKQGPKTWANINQAEPKTSNVTAAPKSKAQSKNNKKQINNAPTSARQPPKPRNNTDQENLFWKISVEKSNKKSN